MHWSWENKYTHPMLEENDEVYRLLERKNMFDIELCLHAMQLFVEQFVRLGLDNDELDGW
jgi:hypothetical protein